MDIRTAYGPHVSCAVDFSGEVSRAKQSFKRECDINQIMAKYQKTGAISHFGVHSGEYSFATSEDFKSSMDIVTKANQMFLELPSSLRSRFGGDPGAFLDFVSDEANAEEMVELGLVEAKAEPVADELEPVAPVAPADKPAEEAVEAD